MTKRATKLEIAEIAAERAYWSEFGDTFGWKLYGWSGKHSATFITDLPRFDTLQFHAYQRDTIMAKLKESAK